MDLRAGQLVGGKYELIRQIGVGGMAAIWSARHVALDSEVAIKFRKPRESDRGATAEARFVAEARNAARVKNRFVIQIHDFGITDDGLSYIVQERLDGDDLGYLMSRGPALRVSDAVKVGCQCLTGLEAVHGAGILHRDLKPENVFLVEDSGGLFPKLLDFGVSKAEPEAEEAPPLPDGARPRHLTEPGNRVGTPEYMSPEQMRGAEVDGTADTYALAMILYELLCGRRPYEFDDVMEKGAATFTEAPCLFDLRPELGEPLSDVLVKAMALTPAGRFRSAADMRGALERTVAELPDLFTVVQSGVAAGPDRVLRDAATTAADSGRAATTSQAPPIVPRARGPVAAIAAALLIVAGFVALWVFAGQGPVASTGPDAAAAGPPAHEAPVTNAEPAQPRPAEQAPAPPPAAAPPSPAPAVQVAPVNAPRPAARPPVAKTRKVGDNPVSPAKKDRLYRDPDF